MSEPMPVVDAHEFHEQLGKLAASNSFRRREKLLRLLMYLFAETIAGRKEQLTQSRIAADFFGLKDPSDQQAGAAVRVSAGRLRNALDEYFKNEAGPNEVRVYVPARAYYLAFDQPRRTSRTQVGSVAAGYGPQSAFAPKKISQSSIIGELGVNLIQKRCLEMGFLWNGTGLEAGIDGYIEVRRGNGEVTNCIIQVQSKATEQPFEAETASEFEFRCSGRDIQYWLGGNAPVILVRSRPSTNEAYWVSLKDYFGDVARQKSGRIVFDKARDRFDLSATLALERLAENAGAGSYLATRPKSEIIYSNLLEVSSLPPKYYVAVTDYRTRGEIFAALQEYGRGVRGEWVLSSKLLTSFHDLSAFPWARVCERGTVEELDTDEWANTADANRQRQFVQLLNSCLREKLFGKGVKFSREDRSYYFRATRDLSDSEYAYQSREHRASRLVFKGYPNRKDPSRVSYYRHSAFEGQFVRYASDWYLQVTPTYRFTRDGERPSRYSADLLSGIKRLETNQAVHGQVVMWAHLLTERSLFDSEGEFLGFGSLLEFELDVGLDDDSWLKREEDPEKSAMLKGAFYEQQRSFSL